MERMESNLRPIIWQLKNVGLDFPINYDGEIHYPKFVKSILEEYYQKYTTSIQEYVDDSARGGRIAERILSFNSMISEVLNLYYSGNLFEATQKFKLGISEIISIKIPNSIQKIPVNRMFYRARISENKQLLKKDLFHIKFEERHLVSTNRYSMPGFPALYLADSTYTCWEEFNRYKIKEIWFSKFTNTRELNVVKIERIEDFIESLENKSDSRSLEYIYDYLVLFPLALICSIKVKNPKGNFKPEYIIPQLLLQNISDREDIDGIKFPSTKVDYSKLKHISSYNYIFPVKSAEEEGFCPKLDSMFNLTEPTTLEMEEIVYNSHSKKNASFLLSEHKQINLFNDKYSPYKTTAFGKLEEILSVKNVLILILSLTCIVLNAIFKCYKCAGT